MDEHVLLCTESIRDKVEREMVISEITDSKKNIKPKTLIDINYDEMMNMCGNMMMLRNKKGENCLVMSERAKKGLRK